MRVTTLMRLAAAGLATLAALAPASVAHGVPDPDAPAVANAPDAPTAADSAGPWATGAGGTVRLTGRGPGLTKNGFLAPASFNPLRGYPGAGYDTKGFRRLSNGFAGTLRGSLRGGEQLEFYCIDLLTRTAVGLTYQPGTWSAGTVPNVAHVARLLNEYYPAVPAAPALGSQAERAAAVQSAIWFFTDRFVLPSGDPLFDAVTAIVSAALRAGPLPEPVAPTLSLTGPANAPTGQVTGPFTVNSSASQATLSVTGGRLFRDAAGTRAITNGSRVDAGSTFFLRPSATSGATISASATLTVPSGGVWLYAPGDRAAAKPKTAQKIILTRPRKVAASTKVKVPPHGKTPPPATSHPAPPPPLANTGTDVRTPIGIGLGLVLLGGLAVLVGRRRRING